MLFIMKLENYLIYPAVFIHDPNEKGYSVTVLHENFEYVKFPNEWVTCGDSYDDAMVMAQDLIISWAEEFIKEKVKFPKAPPLAENQQGIILPYHTALKIMIRNLMIKERYRVVDLANMLQTSKQNIHKALDLRKQTNIDTLFNIFKFIGHPVKVEC